MSGGDREEKEREDLKQCKACGGYFSLATTGGSWNQKIFCVTCPNCQRLIGTQTHWYQFRPVKDFFNEQPN